jgi:hypothetical protein
MTKNIETTKKYKDLLNRFVIKIKREDYLGYLEWDFGLHKGKKDSVLLEKFNQLKTMTVNDDFVFVAIHKLVRPYEPEIDQFKEKIIDLYCKLITFICERNGSLYGIKGKPPLVYVIDTQSHKTKIEKIIDII